MELRDIRTLTLLREFEKNQHTTQRELAKKLDISLGMVNLYLKRLAQKSYFKIKTYPKNRMGYLLTPKGIVEKTRLTCEYVHYSLGVYSQARSRLKNLLARLESRGIRTMAFWGANEMAEIAYVSLRETSIELVAVIDDAKVGESFMGYHVMSTKAMDPKAFELLLDNTVPPRDGDCISKKVLPIRQDRIVNVWQS